MTAGVKTARRRSRMGQRRARRCYTDAGSTGGRRRQAGEATSGGGAGRGSARRNREWPCGTAGPAGTCAIGGGRQHARFAPSLPYRGWSRASLAGGLPKKTFRGAVEALRARGQGECRSVGVERSVGYGGASTFAHDCDWLRAPWRTRPPRGGAIVGPTCRGRRSRSDRPDAHERIDGAAPVHGGVGVADPFEVGQRFLAAAWTSCSRTLDGAGEPRHAASLLPAASTSAETIRHLPLVARTWWLRST